MVKFKKGDRVKIIGGKGFDFWKGWVDDDFWGDKITPPIRTATEAMMLRYADESSLEDKAEELYECLKKRLKGGENKMSKTLFKVGDYIWPVDLKAEFSCGTLKDDIEGGRVKKILVYSIDEDSTSPIRWEVFDGDGKRLYGTCCRLRFSEMKKVSSTGLMSKLAILAKKLLDADTKTFVKAGFLDESLKLTEDGKEFLLTQYFADNKTALAKEAKVLLDEQEKEAKE